MTDEDFVRAFEACTLPYGQFAHRDHVRLAWVYLSRMQLAEALARYDAGLRRYAASLGVPQKYHATVTWAYLVLIHERMHVRDAGGSFEAFAAENPDLFDRDPSLLRCFSPAGPPGRRRRA